MATLKQSVRAEVKAQKERNINSMDTSAILWHLLKRHYSFLVTAAFLSYIVATFVIKYR